MVAFIIGVVRGAFPGALLALQANSAPTSQHAVAAAMIYVTTGILNSLGVVFFYLLFKYSIKLPMYVTAGLQLASFIAIAKVAKYNDIQKKEESKLQNKNMLDSMGLLEGGKKEEKEEEKKKIRLDSKQESFIKIDCQAINSSDE